MTFDSEKQFEDALITLLGTKGWDANVLVNYDEKMLLVNWKNILSKNNNTIDRLNGCELTDGEMNQVLEQITNLRTPLKLNGFINGKTVSVVRDNTKDTLHFGKEVSLKIYDRQEIAAGQSVYQIVRQPRFKSKSEILNNRRGDLMLLINGMPVIHIELKKSGIPVSQATNQIEKYSDEGIFTGIFSLVQIFVAMNPEETVYFANPGIDGRFNPDYYFHWADFDNEPINDYQRISKELLSIPMAHKLIGFYTVADNSDGVLKVMRSYQYCAANAISDKVTLMNKERRWGSKKQLGGFVWHTTGSGKTMTSFKSAQLIANSGDADKVVFLTDRIELGTQSLKEYRGFAEESDSLQATENSGVLMDKLKSNKTSDALIVTSIQKMSIISDEKEGMNSEDIEKINAKRIVFIVDEAHRSTFGDMLKNIKQTFDSAIFFGFTGTPIHEENKKKKSTTSTVFGDELHRYSIADGIRDKNVLGFDPYKILTFQDNDVRKQVAIHEAKAKDEQDAITDPAKSKIYYRFMDNSKIPMAGCLDDTGNKIKGIEDYLPISQYQTDEHRNEVVGDIKNSWLTLSHNNKFHGIFATSSIPDAIEYYRLLKKVMPYLKTTCLFDPNIDNNGNVKFKEDGLVEIIEDYNERYNQEFILATHSNFKKDIALRLAHKDHYKALENDKDKQLDLLIVVDQMLTGFDSKWVNTLYLDKLLEYANIIQAFSRTNRLFGPEKPFGTIRYYRKPHTMQKRIEDAVKLYSGDRPIALFVDKLPENIEIMKVIYTDIIHLFHNAGIENLERLPDSVEEKGQFAKLFKTFNQTLEAANVQGFSWEKEEYFLEENKEIVLYTMNETMYLVMSQRYKELAKDIEDKKDGEITPYDLVGHLTQIDTGMIDSKYMNSRFEKYLRLTEQDSSSTELIEEALNELHKTFATLSREEQKYADIFLHDIQRGSIIPVDGKTLRDYITEYMFKAKDDEIVKFVEIFGVDETKLRYMISLSLTETNINEFGRFEDLKSTIDKSKAKDYFESTEGVKLIPPKVNQKADRILRDFILTGGFEI